MSNHSPIKILPSELVNRIAAGEVVERPASALKEVLENSLDAGARALEITVERGGQGLISVQDDGQGMTAEDMALALTRHATSKIESFDDLFSIHSFGFRGEALPSIASVSRMKITSKPAGSSLAQAIELDYGQIVRSGPAALARGTLVEIRDMFTNIPARLKFLKSQATEWERCKEAVFRLAMARPDVAVVLRQAGQEILNLPAGQSLRDRLAAFWPPHITEAMAEFRQSWPEEGLAVHGLMCDPRQAQARAGHMLFYVNGRAVQDKLLIKCVRDAYAGRLLGKEYPRVLVFIELPTDMVDVNVHPAKHEVRFRDQSRIYALVRRALEQGLQTFTPDEDVFSAAPAQASPAPGHVSGLSGPARPWPAEDAWLFRSKKSWPEQVVRDQPSAAMASRFGPPGWPGQRAPYQDPASLPGPEQTQPRSFQTGGVQGLNYLGQVHNTYLVLTNDQGKLILLDQHAVHERVLYEKFKASEKDRESRPLLMPVELELHASERDRLDKIGPHLIGLGFSFELSGDRLSVSAAPAVLPPEQIRESLRELLSEQGGRLEALWKMLACRAAVKAGQELTPDEAAGLIKAWRQTSEPDFCPHGRPVSCVFSALDLEKLFKRK